MTKQEVKAITEFLDKEFRDYSIEYDYFIEDSTMEVTIKDVFSKGDVEFTFKYSDNEVQFYSLSDSYIEATTRQFWIELMSKLYE